MELTYLVMNVYTRAMECLVKFFYVYFCVLLKNVLCLPDKNKARMCRHKTVYFFKKYISFTQLFKTKFQAVHVPCAVNLLGFAFTKI